MGLVNGGLINVGSHGAGAATQLALSDGLACFTGSFSGVTTTSISHGLSSTNLVVEFKDQLGNLLIPDNWSITNPNVIEADFSPAATGDVTILACIESGLAPITGGVTSVEGLSGVIDLDSPNGSILISTSGQVINLNAIFTPASGAVLEQKCRDIDILSGLIDAGGGGGGGVTSINNISGVITLTSTNDGLQVGVNGQSIEFTSLFTGASGAILEQKCEDIITLSGLIGTGGGTDAGQTSINGVSGVTFVSGVNLEVTVSGQTILVSGIMNAASGAILEQKCQDVLTLSGITDGLPRTQTSINGLSGVLSITSPDNTILVGDSPQTIELSGLFTQASGAVLEQKCEDLITLSGTVNGVNERLISLSGLTDGLPRTQTSINGLSGVLTLASPDNSILIGDNGQTLELSGLFTPESGILVNRQIHERRWQGAVSGLAITINPINSGLFDLSEGVAYVSGIRLEISAQSGIDPQFPPGSGAGCGQQVGFVALDYTGTIFTQIGGVLDHGKIASAIDLGVVKLFDPASANSGLLSNAHPECYEILNRDYNNQSWMQHAVGAVVASGIIISDNGSLTLSESVGVFYDRHQNQHNHPDDTPANFQLIYRDGAGDYRFQGFTTIVPNTVYDNGLGLVAMNGNRYAMHSFWVDVITNEHFLVVSDEQHDSLQIAQDAPINAGCIIDSSNIIPIAKIIIRRNQTVFSGTTGRIIDVRPIIGARGDAGTLTTSATSLQQAYENSLAGAEIILQEEQGGLTIADNAVPLVNNGTHLFEVHNSDETVEYFQVNGSGIYASSGIIEHRLGVGEGFVQGSVARCTLDVSGLICTSGLEVVGSRPTVSGIGVALLTDLVDTQMTLNGLSGAVTLGSPNDTISIVVNGQVIELDGIFTWASGQLLESLANASGVQSINSISGILDLIATNDGITVSNNGQVIELSTLFTSTSGQLIDQKCQDIDTVSGIAIAASTSISLDFTSTSGTEFVMQHDFSSAKFTWGMWDTSTTPHSMVIPENIVSSGVDHVLIQLNTPMNGFVNLVRVTD